MRTSESLSSFVKQIHKRHHFHEIKKSLIHFFAKLAGIKNSQVRLNNQSCKYYKVFSNHYLTQAQQINQTGFVSHFGPRQEPALILHGSDPRSMPGEGFIYYKGTCVDFKKMTGEKAVHKLLNVHDFVEIVKKDFGLDLRRNGNTGNQPLHLICCFSGGRSPKSVAGQLARELERSVICYGETQSMFTSPALKSHMDETAKVFCEEIFLKRKVISPMYEIIHLPDNNPGEVRV